jgi:3-deoxy-manno-octulosonate cytidylyltransferase (CMP-KDO synthetase)
MDEALGVIPVRYGSTRFPGKPLAPILGRPMVQWVYEGARRSRLLDRIVIATDDVRIFDAAKAFGAEVVMTSAAHASGTDRVAEVAASARQSIVINIQGDEPLIRGEAIDRLVEVIRCPDTAMASLMARVADLTLLDDPNVVKVVTDANGWALYFSRSPLPHGASDHFFQHIGIYGYRREFLLGLKVLPSSRLERAERLEQLRVLESGGRIRMVEVERPTLCVDTPEDIMRLEKLLKEETR